MKNDYEIEGDVVKIKVNCQDKYYNCLIDKDDFDKVNQFDITWFGAKRNGHIYVEFTNARTNSYYYDKQQTNQIKLHQLIMDFPDYEKGYVVDHINRNPLDNRKENLRIATMKENAINRDYKNRAIPKNNKSGYPGVYWSKKDKRWWCEINYNKKRDYLGMFDDKAEAIKARKEAEEKYWG